MFLRPPSTTRLQTSRTTGLAFNHVGQSMGACDQETSACLRSVLPAFTPTETEDGWIDEETGERSVCLTSMNWLRPKWTTRACSVTSQSTNCWWAASPARITRSPVRCEEKGASVARKVCCGGTSTKSSKRGSRAWCCSRTLIVCSSRQARPEGATLPSCSEPSKISATSPSGVSSTPQIMACRNAAEGCSSSRRVEEVGALLRIRPSHPPPQNRPLCYGISLFSRRGWCITDRPSHAGFRSPCWLSSAGNARGHHRTFRTVSARFRGASAAANPART